jgi:hypothetical protein
MAEQTSTESPSSKGTLDQVGRQARQAGSQAVSAATEVAHDAQARGA